MIATLTIAGEPIPLNQVTIRRDSIGGEMSLQIAGHHDISVGAECILTVATDPPIVSTVTESTPGPRLTSVTASLPAATGTGVFDPIEILVRGDTGLRAPLDFTVLPGDTLGGIEITRITHTMGASSPWFTQVWING